MSATVAKQPSLPSLVFLRICLHRRRLSFFSFFFSLLLLLLLATTAQAQAQEHHTHTRPFSRLQSTTGGGNSNTHQTRKEAAAGKEEPEDFTKPTERVGYLLNLTKNGLDPIQVFKDAMNTKGFKAILQNTDVQKRVLKEMPILGAIEGFSQIAKNRRLSEEETKSGFAQGMENLIVLAEDAFLNKVNDPAKVSATIAKMAASSDPDVQALFKRAQAGEKEAVLALQDQFAQEHYKGLDGKALREISQAQGADKMKQLPEMWHFIEKDPNLAKVFSDLSSITPEFFSQLEEERMATAAAR